MNTKYKRTEIEHFQCKAIKKGDELFLPVTFKALHDGGIVEVNTPTGYKCFGCFSFIIPEPEPKYDPCRPFKAGDIVEPVSCNGRVPLHLRKYIGTKQVVERDEDYNGIVGIVGDIEAVSAAFLKLVTPVEEMERYILIHNEYEKYYEVCWKCDDEPDGRTGRTRCRAAYWYHLPPQTYSQKEAKAAAEAERDRLNREYGKEKNNA